MMNVSTCIAKYSEGLKNILNWFYVESAFKGNFILIDCENKYGISGIGTTNTIVVTLFARSLLGSFEVVHGIAEAWEDSDEANSTAIVKKFENTEWYQRHITKPRHWNSQVHYAIRAMQHNAGRAMQRHFANRRKRLHAIRANQFCNILGQESYRR